MSCGRVSAVVYIWYPDGNNLGHASMYIGDPIARMGLDLPYDAFFSVQSRRANKAFIARMNTHYVSWWPEKAGGFLTRCLQDRMYFLEQDIEAEQASPHVEYKLDALDEQAMCTAWEAIRNKPGAHYQALRKNCSTIVMRVLQAGGALQRLSPLKRAFFLRSPVVTPKQVAQLCNELRNAGFAKKTKDRDCPEKRGFNFGLR